MSTRAASVQRQARVLALGVIALLFPFAARAAHADEPGNGAPTAEGEGSSTLPGSQPEKEWSTSASVNVYVPANTRTYAQPTLAADRKWLHLEARYNYEALDTGSAWLGYNFAFGENPSLELTPMVGGVFGNTNGVAPGYQLTLTYWKLEIYSEGEYLFDTGDSSGDFTYTWSELSLAPVEWLRFGIVAQRTRAYETALDVQRGPFLGFSYKWFSFATYVFDPAQRARRRSFSHSTPTSEAAVMEMPIAAPLVGRSPSMCRRAPRDREVRVLTHLNPTFPDRRTRVTQSHAAARRGRRSYRIGAPARADKTARYRAGETRRLVSPARRPVTYTPTPKTG